MSLDEHVREIVAFHFNEQSGTPFWLRRRSTLGFDPIREIRTVADLTRFPDVADEWRTAPARDLLPAGLAGPARVWESGGTTGAPRRVVLPRDARYQDLSQLSHLLDQHGLPSAARGDVNRDWLHVAPAGPHQVWWSRQQLAWHREALLFLIDCDPRWVKALYRGSRSDEVQRYVDHLLDQALEVLRSQPIGVLSITPPLLQAATERPEIYALIREKVRGVIWFGTHLSDEGLRTFTDELLPGVAFVGVYGNTMSNGGIWQDPPRPEDDHRCIFGHYRPGWPAFLATPVDPATRQPVAYGESGQVLLHALQREVFLPNHIERDLAVRLPPRVEGEPNRLARVRPAEGPSSAVEGVY
jgi:hypothetical protein